MSAITHRDYIDHLFEDSERSKRVTQQVLGNCERALNVFSDFMKGRFVETSNLAKSLTYAKVESIKEAIQQGVLEGFRLYVCVANLNNKAISHRPNQDIDKMYNSFSENGQFRDQLLARYDVMPVIERYTDVIFSTFLGKNPEFENYAYKDTNHIRLVIFVAVQNAYLLSLVGCE